MGTAICKLVTGKLDVRGIAHFTNVVVDAVTGMPVDGLRLLETARSLLVRLAWREAAGLSATSPCCLRPVATSATWAPEPAGSGMAQSHLYKRLGRPGSAIRVFRF